MARSKSSTCLLARASQLPGTGLLLLLLQCSWVAPLSVWDLGTKPWRARALVLFSVRPFRSLLSPRIFWGLPGFPEAACWRRGAGKQAHPAF